MNKVELTQKLDDLINELVEEYEDKKNKRLFLTESDVVSRAFSKILRSSIIQNQLSVHCEMKPFSETVNYPPSDLVLIDTSEKYWEKAKDRMNPSYWRVASYPIEALRAIIEFKIRVKGNVIVKGNKKGINKDVLHLKHIREKYKDCLTYLVVLDRKGTDEKMKEIKDEFDSTTGLRFFTNIESNEFEKYPISK